MGAGVGGVGAADAAVPGRGEHPSGARTASLPHGGGSTGVGGEQGGEGNGQKIMVPQVTGQDGRGTGGQEVGRGGQHA